MNSEWVLGCTVFIAWARGLPLVGLLIWFSLILLVHGRRRMLPADLGWMTVLGLGGILWLLAPMNWLPQLLARSLIGGSRPISLFLLSSVSTSGLLKSLALVPPSSNLRESKRSFLRKKETDKIQGLLNRNHQMTRPTKEWQSKPG